ncbi:FHA domain-containing protein [Candidatus Woesearchaeota archaeon]|nr:FHA domain-containing protein [Candidatus Woesearchaeota archaeon]
MKTLYVRAVLFLDGKFINWKTIKKPSNQLITVGQDHSNDIAFNLEGLSAKHGRIFIENSLLTEHLDYEDYSHYGTHIMHWQGNGMNHNHIHRKKTKLGHNDWIMFMNSSKSQGIILIPYLE